MKKLLILALLTIGPTVAAPKLASTLGYGDVPIEDSLQALHDEVQSLAQMFQK